MADSFLGYIICWLFFRDKDRGGVPETLFLSPPIRWIEENRNNGKERKEEEKVRYEE